MPNVFAESDVGIIAYSRIFGVNSLPGRLFEYMAGALPVIAPEYSGDVRGIVERERCGIMTDCEDAQAIAKAIAWLNEHREEATAMGGRGRHAFLTRHTFEREIQPLIDWICD
jgi:glycosyltransferase involved in cell wall biosynthesis